MYFNLDSKKSKARPVDITPLKSSRPPCQWDFLLRSGSKNELPFFALLIFVASD